MGESVYTKSGNNVYYMYINIALPDKIHNNIRLIRIITRVPR